MFYGDRRCMVEDNGVIPGKSPRVGESVMPPNPLQLRKHVRCDNSLRQVPVPIDFRGLGSGHGDRIYVI